MSAYDDLLAGATPSLTYDDWWAAQQMAQQQAGGDAGLALNPNDYANQVTYGLPGYGDNWQWDVATNQYVRRDPTKSTPGVNNYVSVLHDDGNGGVYTGEQNWDISPNKFEHVLGDYIMPLAVGAITAGAGYAAVGGYMAAGGAAAGAGEGAAASAAAGTGEGAAAGTAASGTAAGAGEAAAAQAPAWSQAGNTALGSGMYGTSNADMAALYGTTADSGAGLGSGIGSGVAADGGAWAGAGGGWPGIMAQAGSGSGLTLADALKYGKNAYQAYNALHGASAGGTGAQALGSGLASYGGASKGSAPAFSSSVQMPQQAQQAAPAPFLLQTAPIAGTAAKDTSQDEINNSSNILRLAAALRSQTA